jgi:integron integrase
LIHIRLRGFSPADVDAIKAIPGRRWVPERRLWTVPNTGRSVAALTSAFAGRLLLGPQGATQGDVEAPPPRDASGVPTARPTGVLAADPTRGRAADPTGVLAALSLAVKAREYSPKTERAYLAWVRRFLAFDPAVVEPGARLDPARGKAFLEHLARDARLGAKTRNQAASALGFMFREVLGQDGFEDVPRAKGPRRLPSVLSHREVLRVLRELSGDHRLIAGLLYSAGLRLDECLHLRVKDIDFELRQILVRDGKGKKDRYVPLAHRAVDVLRKRVLRRSELHDQDRRAGQGWAPLPGALDRKDPGAGYELGWQFVFPARIPTADAATGRIGRCPIHASAVQREVKRAVRRAQIDKRASCHTFRHSFATEALRGGCDIRTLQHVLGHNDVRTTMIYLHVVEQTGFYVRSPLDRPDDPDQPDGPLWDADPAPPVARLDPYPDATITPSAPRPSTTKTPSPQANPGAGGGSQVGSTGFPGPRPPYSREQNDR